MYGQETRIAQPQSGKAAYTESQQYQNPSRSGVNLSQIERILSSAVGGWLLKRNLGGFSVPGLLKMIAGGALLRRGIKGHSCLYETMHLGSVANSNQTQMGASELARHFKAAITVQMPPFDTYQLWRDPVNQGWVMGHFAKLETLSADRARWTLRNPIGAKMQWESLIVADSPGEMIRWESLPGAGIANEGTVRFLPTETGGTRVVFECLFDAPSNMLGHGLMKLLGLAPESIVGKALRRFKTMAEMGVPTAPSSRTDTESDEEPMYLTSRSGIGRTVRAGMH